MYTTTPTSLQIVPLYFNLTTQQIIILNPKVIIRFLGIRCIGGAPTFQKGTSASISMLA